MINRNTLLSVIVPVYNVEQYLSKCIESILNQSNKNIELILVDDGSTDNSGYICDKYAKDDSRIHVIHKQNGGPITARYEGVCNATGEFVTFVDSDDWIDSRMYETLMALCLETKADIIMSSIYRYFSDDRILWDKNVLPEGYYNKEAIEEKILPTMLWNPKSNRWNIDPSLCTKIFKKNLLLEQLKNVKCLNIHYGEDPATIYPLMLKINSLYVTNESFYFHRQRDTNVIPGYIQDDEFLSKLFYLYSYLKQEFSLSSYADLLIRQLDFFCMNSSMLKERTYIQYDKRQVGVFPYYLFKKNTKVILYGAGKVGKLYKQQNDEYQFCKIVMWVDKKASADNESVVLPSEICNIEYDYVLIAASKVGLALSIREELLGMQIPKEKIIWAENCCRIIGQ